MIQSGWIVEDLLICWIKYLRACWGQEGACNMTYVKALWWTFWKEGDISGPVLAVWRPFFRGWSLVRAKNYFDVPQSWVMIVCHIHTCWIHFTLGSASVSSYQNVVISQLTHQSLGHIDYISVSHSLSDCISIWAGFHFFSLRDHVAYQVSRESRGKMGLR